MESSKAEGGITLNPVNGDGSFTSSEKARLVENKQVDEETAKRLRLAILIISWISVLLLGTLGILTLVVSITQNSSAAFAFALDAILDCLSSVVVIWRFTNASHFHSPKKEKIACIALGCLFIVSSIVIITKSSIAIDQGLLPEKSQLIWTLSIVNAVSCFILVFAKLYLAKRLESVAIATDAINSGIGFVLAVSTLASDIVYHKNNSVWYLDPAVGITCSFFLLAYGIWVIVYETRFVKEHDYIEN